MSGLWKFLSSSMYYHFKFRRNKDKVEFVKEPCYLESVDVMVLTSEDSVNLNQSFGRIHNVSKLWVGVWITVTVSSWVPGWSDNVTFFRGRGWRMELTSFPQDPHMASGLHPLRKLRTSLEAPCTSPESALRRASSLHKPSQASRGLREILCSRELLRLWDRATKRRKR